MTARLSLTDVGNGMRLDAMAVRRRMVLDLVAAGPHFFKCVCVCVCVCAAY